MSDLLDAKVTIAQLKAQVRHFQQQAEEERQSVALLSGQATQQGHLIAALQCERDALALQVAKYPRTADGKLISLPMRVFIFDQMFRMTLWVDVESLRMVSGIWTIHGTSQHYERESFGPEVCYSTREACDKAALETR